MPVNASTSSSGLAFFGVGTRTRSTTGFPAASITSALRPVPPMSIASVRAVFFIPSSLRVSAWTQYPPDSVYGGHIPLAHRKNAADEDETLGGACHLAAQFDEFARIDGGEEMRVQLDRRAGRALRR